MTGRVVPVGCPLGADFRHHWWGKHADTGPGPWVREESEHQPPPLQPSSPFQPVRSTWAQAPVLCLSLQPPSKDLCLLGQFSLQVNQEMKRCSGAGTLRPLRTRQGTTPSPRGGSPLLPTLAHLRVTGLEQILAGVPRGTAALHSPRRTRLAVSLMDLSGDDRWRQT